MGKGAKGQELANSGTAQGRSGQLYGESQGIGGPLTKQLQGEAANPQGYTPQQMSYMNTANQQSTGGGVASTTGQANLEVARTGNAGGFAGAVGEANRGAQRQESQNALGVQEKQANMQQAQKQQALSSLQHLYGTQLGGSGNYLQESNQALHDENSAPNFMQQMLLQAMSNGEKAASAGAGG